MDRGVSLHLERPSWDLSWEGVPGREGSHSARMIRLGRESAGNRVQVSGGGQAWESAGLSEDEGEIGGAGGDGKEGSPT